MKGNIFHLFVIFLGLSHLVCFKAVPITRSESLIQRAQIHLVLENANNHKDMVINERNWPREEPTVVERMNLELHDYPPSGANGRHTPRVPYP
ncbi:hypothetical protein MtrunA17_Chr3g0092121 [Medicago truncatula]|uniref:Transmembrane protein, putative n=1 Tax=Medicago truncatula TaxID=3880 RepID=A0A072UUM3_MEDTR|nr:transmembrane protein, putative [Medicago truncatula]RHN66532.1 hypothetical protein MtrunA17_Chr3g0092121 [Medicago truncatula]